MTASTTADETSPEEQALPSIEELAQAHARNLWLFCKYLADEGIQIALVASLYRELAEAATFNDAREMVSALLQSLDPASISRLSPVDEAEQIVEACVNKAVCVAILASTAEMADDDLKDIAPSAFADGVIPTEELIDPLLQHFHLQMPNQI